MKHTAFLFVALSVTVLAAGCRRVPEAAAAPSPAPATAGGAPAELPGLHNVLRVTDRLYSGSAPEGDGGFRSLQQLGVRTVISVDGARPDVARARRFGLRYVHLPIGYDGVPEAQAYRLSRAARDLPGPVYLHCHHGKHRGPAAAAAVRRCLDGACDAEAAVAVLRRAGTDPRYAGLYASVREVRRPTADELDRVPADFPEAAEVGGLVNAMVAVDECWENLKLARAAAWAVPPGHPDVDPAHEALLLAEHYREAGRLPATAGRPGELRRRLGDAEEGARRLEAALRAGSVPGPAEAAFRDAERACAACHGQFRDVRPPAVRGAGAPR
jgi:protein tyrosine phosphatase (PTP) superfamily phosphohydrolase (DUF442 family)